MTTMLPDIDEQAIEDIAMPCEASWTLRDDKGVLVEEKHCQQNADWVVRTTCHCGHVEVDLLCDHHYRMGSSGDPYWGFVCSACRCRGRGVDTQAEPL